MASRTELNDKLHWYKDAIIYELHIKAFFDSNNDGIGDFQGLLQKLDYLQDLGITAIWLLPFYPSPLRDDGYDIADYYSINPRYGNIEQFQQLLAEAHKRNLKVITELVINHTSDQHPWFQRSRTSPKGTAEREYYVWTDDPTQYKDVRIIFQDFETSNWTWDPLAQQYYWHRFFHHQPDLNFDNPLVQEEVFKIIDYWCAMGVDGFRLDAVPYLYEREGTNGENLPETHVFLKKLRAYIEERYQGTCFLAEANMWPEDSASYFGNGDECHMNYHFPVMPRMFMSLQREDRYPITDIIDQTPQIPETCQWATFLRNHDELTLEMVTDEERDYMYKVYAKDPKARINLGIRHRLAPLMDNDRRRIELMNSLLFSLPGTPVIYYGDEIGMGDNFYLGDRDGVRTPMQWSPDRNAGFSATNPQQLYLPVIIDPQYHYESVNVETQRANTSSLFWFMKRLINMRKKYKAFGRGDINFINVDNPKILAFTRKYEEDHLLIVVNLSRYPQVAELDLHEYNGYTPSEIFSKNHFPTVKEGSSYLLTLGPHSYYWFALKKKESEILHKERLPLLRLKQWDEILSTENIEFLETFVLAEYLGKTNWFIGKFRIIHSTSIVTKRALEINGNSTYVFIIEVSYENGLSENYFLPVSLAKAEDAKAIRTDHPGAVIAELLVNEEEGLLIDALYLPAFHLSLVRKLAGIEPPGSFQFITDNEFKQYVIEHPEIRSKMHAGEQLNTCITFDNKYFLKIYRKIDRGTNPDIEISRYLSGDAHFDSSPPYVGSIELNLDFPISIGLLEVMVENHGTGKTFMQERVNNYIERILARDRAVISSYEIKGSLFEPISYGELSEEVKEFIGNAGAEQARLIGIRTGELHLALAAGNNKDFKPEEFSIHYQRSLYSGLQSLVREVFQVLDRRVGYLPEEYRELAGKLQNERHNIVERFRRIYLKKYDIVKTRVHGFYGLNEILLTGKDIMIHNFNGNPVRSYSERRLKRSPARDLAAIIRSIYYVGNEIFLTNTQIRKEELSDLLPFADFWSHYMSSFFMRGYFDTIKDAPFVPADTYDKRVLIETFIIEYALHYLNYELKARPEKAVIPLRLIDLILTKE
jgi:maltose alpha-D-glucosyltransferase / alpha-amylase